MKPLSIYRVYLVFFTMISLPTLLLDFLNFILMVCAPGYPQCSNDFPLNGTCNTHFVGNATSVLLPRDLSASERWASRPEILVEYYFESIPRLNVVDQGAYVSQYDLLCTLLGPCLKTDSDNEANPPRTRFSGACQGHGVHWAWSYGIRDGVQPLFETVCRV